MTETAAPAITDYHLFPSPADLMAETPLPPAAAASVARGRAEVRAVLNGTDDRLLVITGPCSVHDPEAALEYADLLAGTGLAGELLIVMRAYPDKPRTVTGWTGLLNDPAMDGGHDIRRGLREARRLLAGIAALGVPAACEWVSPVVPHYLADAVSWRSAPAPPKVRSTGSWRPACRRRSVSRTRPTAMSRSPPTHVPPQRAATPTSGSRKPARSGSSPAAATRTATWSCAAAGPGRTTTRPASPTRWT